MQNGGGYRLISLTASATYYYRVLGLVLARPSEHVTLRKCNRAWPKSVNRSLSFGEFLNSEFVQVEMMPSYREPTFDPARRALAPISQEAIIEWLGRRGGFTMPPLERKKRFRRGIKEYALVILPSRLRKNSVRGRLRTIYIPNCRR